MKYYQVINVINSFSAEEIKEFKKYLGCSYLSSDKSLGGIYSALLKLLNKPGLIDFKTIKIKLAAKTKYDVRTIANKLSLLANEALNFVKHRLNNKSLYHSCIFLDDWLIEKDLGKLFLKRQKNFRKQLFCESIPNTNIEDEYFHILFLNEVNDFNYSIMSGIHESVKSNRLIASNLNHSTEYLFLYFIVQLTSVYVNYILHLVDKGGKTDVKYFFRRKYLSAIYSEIPVFTSTLNMEIFSLYKNLYLLINNYNASNSYRKYKNSVLSYNRKNENSVAKYHLNTLMNFCTMMTRLGIRVKYFRNEALVARFINIKLEYAGLNAKVMSPTDYRNFDIDCVNAGKFNLLNDFVKEYSSRLLYRDIDKMKAFAMAFYHYGLKEYSKCRTHLSKLNLNKFLYKYDLIHLRLKLNYDTNEMDLFNSDLHNYERKIKSDKMFTAYDKNVYSKPVKFLITLAKLKSAENIETLVFEAEKLKAELTANASTFQMKKWITKMVDNVIMQIKTKRYSKYKVS